MNKDYIAATISESVDAGRVAGAEAVVWQDGRVLEAAVAGWRDIEVERPMEPDTLFRVASMTKPVTSTAALMLFDEGAFELTDPVARWAPEFSEMRVLRSPDGPLDETDPASRPITFEDLLTHRSGLTYGDFHAGPIAEAYREALGGDIDSDVPPDEWIARLAALPLIDQPGASFRYGHSTDLLGLLIARIEGAPLSDVLKRRVFDPLGMDDTGFTVAPEKRGRRAAAHGFDDAGRLCVRLTGPGGSFLPERPREMAYVSGGQGLWSTARDYLTFARLFVGSGAVDGVRLLRPDTFERMVTDHLTEDQRARAGFVLGAGHGFGLGVAVVTDPETADLQPCGGGVGAVGWPGGFGGWWRADPTDESVLVFLAHNMVELEQLADGVGFGVYEAIADFQEWASLLKEVG